MVSLRFSRLLAASVLAAGFHAIAVPVSADESGSVAPGEESRCVLKGDVQMQRDVPLYSERLGGEVVARFGGARVPLFASDFPATAAARVPVQTGRGTGSFRIPGYVQANKIPLYTRTAVAVVADHVWIGAGQSVTFIGAASDRLTIKKRVRTPIYQTFTASASCSAFTLEARVPPAWDIPGEARAYVVKQNFIELFDGARTRRSVLTLQRAPDSAGILLWSSERRRGFVHVEYHGEVVIDAWARASDLHALAPGETMDQPHAAVSRQRNAHLSYQNKPVLARSTKLMPIRISANESARIVGYIEPDTELYLLDTFAGWTSVLPRSLNLLPNGEGHFWIRSSDLGEPERDPAAEAHSL